MGGSSYSRPVYSSSKGSSHSNKSRAAYQSVEKAHKDVLPSGDRRISTNVKNPIVIALDVTGSMGESTKIMFDKMPMFWGQIEQKGYLEDPAVSFVAIGDAYTDEAPLQVTDFEKGIAIDPWLKKIWLEGNGGGQTMESYDLAALFFLEKCSVPNMEHGFFFFIGDEGYYPLLDGKSTVPIFQELMNCFDTYFIHWPYRQSTIDDKRIVEDWRAILGERLLILKDPKAIVDVILGFIAMSIGIRDLNSYAKDLKDKGQDPDRIKTVVDILSKSKNLPAVRNVKMEEYKKNIGLLSNRDPFRKRKIV